MAKGDVAIETILDTTEQLILSQGYNGTSMRDIAQAAGYKSVAGLYNHFPDKEAIFVALLESRSPYPKIFEQINRIDAPRLSDFLPQMFAFVTALMQEHQSFFQLVLLDYLEFRAVHVRNLILEMQEQIVGILSRVQHFEDIREDVPLPAIMRLIGMSMVGYVLTRNILPPAILGMLSDEAWQAGIVDGLLHGLSKEQPHE